MKPTLAQGTISNSLYIDAIDNPEENIFLLLNKYFFFGHVIDFNKNVKIKFSTTQIILKIEGAMFCQSCDISNISH